MSEPLPFAFGAPLPMPASAAALVSALEEAAATVGAELGLRVGRLVPSTCGTVRRAATAQLEGAATVWAPIGCGLPGTALVLLTAADAIALADLLLGGPGETDDRPSTPLERQLVVLHVLPALRALVAAVPGTTSLSAGDAVEGPLPAGCGEVLAVPVDLTLPSGATVTVTLCLPARSALPAEPAQAEEPALDPAVQRVLADVPLTITVRTAAVRMPAADLTGLAPGDVIALDEGAGDGLEGLLATGGPGRLVLRASLGQRAPRRAVVVHDLHALGDLA